MKKRIAFTLAEVLITLTIIGVIASLTIPVLLVNLQKQGDYSKLLKAVSVITSAGNQIRMDNGGSMAGVMKTSLDVANLFAAKMSYVKFCSNQTDSPNCYISNSDDMYNLQGGVIAGISPYPYSNYPKMVTNDGFVYFFQLLSSNCQDTHDTINGHPETCAAVFVDINGSKSPNAWGKDIFLIFVNDQDVIVSGSARDQEGAVASCSMTNPSVWNGSTCAGRATLNGGIKYY